MCNQYRDGVVNRRKSFILTAIIICLLGGAESYAQTPVDSILIYKTIQEADQIRRIIRENFSLLSDAQEQQIRIYDSLAAAIEDSGGSNVSAKYYMKSGDILFRAGLYARAGEEYLRSAENALKADDSAAAAAAYMRIGRVYYFASTGDYNQMYKKAYEYIRYNRDKQTHVFSLYLQNLFEEDKERKNRRINQIIAMQREILSEMPDDSTALERMGVYLNAASRPAEAIAYAKRAGNPWSTVVYINNAGYNEVLRGNYRAAEPYFLQSYQICKQERYLTLIRNTVENLGRVYSFLNRKELSISYLYLMHFFEEIIFEKRFVLQSSEFEVKLRTKEKEHENQLLRREQSALEVKLESEKQENILYSILLVVVISSAFILYRSRVKLAKINKALDRQNEQIRRQKTELEDLNIDLLESESKLRFAQRTARLGNWSCNIITKECSVSKYFPGLTDTETIKDVQSFCDTLLQNIHQEDYKAAEAFFRNLENESAHEITIRMKGDDDVTWMHVKRTVVKNNDGQPVEIVGTIQDVTEAKLAEENKIKMAAQQAFTEQLIESQEEERKRIAGDLHESIGQEILLIKNRALLASQDEEQGLRAKNLFDEINKASAQALSLVREIAFDLRPANIELLGLVEAVKGMLQKMESLSGIMIEFNADYGNDTVLPKEEIHIYRIIQEAVNNIVKHSGADYAEITLQGKAGGVALLIADNGKGFSNNKPSSKGFGLNSILNRVSLLGGTCSFDQRNGGGTIITIYIPGEKHG